MIQSIRVCKMKGHDELPIFHICSLLECNQPTRWCCSQCIQEGLHNHNTLNNSHVMKTKELLIKLKSESERFKENFNSHKAIQINNLGKIIKKCQELENFIIDYRKKIESQMQNIQDNYENLRKYSNNLVLNNFEKLDDIKINELLKINLQQFDKNHSLFPLDNIKQSLNSIESIIQDYCNNKSENFNLTVDSGNRKYITQEIDQIYISQYYGSSISKNEQYLAYGGSEKLLKIYEIKLKKIIKNVILDYQIVACQFTQDSSQLYVGLKEGYVYGYQVQDDFKQIYKQIIHQQDVFNIITIKNKFIITSSYDKSIIKTDVENKQQIFKLTGHTNYVYAIDYNDKDEIIVSGSDDKSIKLWNCKNQSLIINKEQSHNKQIRQVQLLNDRQNILSLDIDGNLYKWQIDLINKDLIKLQQFSDQNKIFNFYQGKQDQKIILICINYVKILNQQGETLNTIEHNGKDSTRCDCRQLDDLRYIQIRADKKIILAIAQD